MVTTRSASKATKKQEEGEELFLKGVAISTWQNSSDENLSNWTRYSYKRWPFQSLGLCLTHQGPHVAKSCNFWERYREDIELAAKIGSNTFRFSFEWGRIEPRPGEFDPLAIQRFHEMLDCMEEHGIEPNATLHHFTHPLVRHHFPPACIRPSICCCHADSPLLSNAVV
jgi:beta-glucosidase